MNFRYNQIKTNCHFQLKTIQNFQISSNHEIKFENCSVQITEIKKDSRKLFFLILLKLFIM